MSSQIFAGDLSGSVTIQCPAVAGTNVLTLPLSNGLIPGEMIYRLNTGVTGIQTAAAAQSILGVGITLNSSTVYQFQGVYLLAKTAGVTSHTVSLLFGGTATVNNIAYTIGWNATTSYNVPDTGAYFTAATQTSAVVITGARTAASEYGVYQVFGTVSVNAGGTFIPQYLLSADPGGAYTTQVGSYFKISPLSTAGTNTNIGGWA